MITNKAPVRATAKAASNCLRQQSRARRFFNASSPYALRRRQHFVRSVAIVLLGGSAASLYQWTSGKPIVISDVHGEEPPPEQAEPVVEKPRKRKGASKEEARAEISSQHLQVRKSWENPGVFCWGNNEGKVAAPDANADVIRTPRWMSYFDGKLLRDMKLTGNFGAAITEHGDLLQWGTAYADEATEPVATLKGKDLTKLAISRDRVIALSSSGQVYSLSVNQEEQRVGPKPSETSAWSLGLWSSKSPISYRELSPADLGWTEKITSIAGGLEHVLLLTSKGRVFSAAAASEAFPARGQLGISGLRWFTRPKGPYDMPHEIHDLGELGIQAIAAGDYHSLALDKRGRVFAWGDNQRGQLGISETSKDKPFFDHPQLVPITKLYAGTLQSPKITGVRAGGNTSFFFVDATRIADPNADVDSVSVARQGLGRVTADVWASGHGIWGQLGNGRWTHVQAVPTKITALSGMFEYDEKLRRAIPIRIKDISVGANHCCATLDNVTYTEAGNASSSTENDTNWGSDVLFFGNNEFFQLGTGKRNNLVTPTYIMPLDQIAEVREGKRPKQEFHRFHATPQTTVRLGNRWVTFEQRVVCGRGITAVFSGV